MAAEDRNTARIVVEFDPTATPVCGQLVPATGAAREFQGWLDLTRALEALINEAAEAAHPATHPAPPAP